MEYVITDVEAETADLRSLIAKLPDGPAAWDAPTPATGWAVRDQISHLVRHPGDRGRAPAEVALMQAPATGSGVPPRRSPIPAPALRVEVDQ